VTRLLVAVVAIAAVFWVWDQLFGLNLGSCSTVAYPARCQGAVIGNHCHGELSAALPRRMFAVDPTSQRVMEAAAATSSVHPRCRVTDCAHWECIDEVFLRTARDGEFAEQLRPGLAPVDPARTLSVVYVPAWKWWQLRAQALVEEGIARLQRR
jgi:hypothetical protein